MDTNILSQLKGIGRELYRRRLTSSTGGNISVRVGDRVYITRSRSSLGFLGDDDIVEVSLDGSWKGDSKPSSELPLHLAIYRKIDWASAVVHAHPPYSIALFREGYRLFPVGTEARMVLRRFRVVPGVGVNITNVDDVIDALKECPVTFVSNHGSVAAGKTLLEAFGLTDLLESEAMVLALRGRETLVITEGRFSVRVDIVPQGSDVILFVGGSELPHVGGVVVSLPEGTTHVIRLLGHRDDVVLKVLAEGVSRATGRKVAAIGGVHWDGIGKEDIKTILGMFERAVSEVASRIMSLPY